MPNLYSQDLRKQVVTAYDSYHSSEIPVPLLTQSPIVIYNLGHLS